MALSHTVNNMPEQKQHHVHFGLLRSKSTTQSDTDSEGDGIRRQLPRTPDDLNMLKFPVTKNVLWDHTSDGEPVHFSISYFRKPKFHILEKVLRFAQRHAESTGQSVYNCALLGTLDIAEDGEGITFVIDRFDPGGVTSSGGGITPGDITVPFMISGHSKNERFSSMEDYVNALMVLKDRCCGKDPVQCSNYLLTKGWCNFYKNGDKCVHHLEFDVVTMATEFIATPISPVPIVPTALSKNLSGPMSLSHLQGEPKSGYLTMDHTRKVLLVLESDPKAYNLPLVGIWLSGVPFIYSPYVWAACLRFMYNASIHDRVCVPPDSFLIVLYNPMHSRPEFYEVTTSSGSSKMTFDLFTGHEAISLSKNMSSSPEDSIEIDLVSVENGNKKEMLDAALHSVQSQLNSLSSDGSNSPKVPTSDDITPRCKPAPHKSKLPAVVPMVPEVSLLFADDGQSGILSNTGPRKLITQGRPNGVNKLTDFVGSHVPQKSTTGLPSSQNCVPCISHPRPSRMTHHAQSAPNLHNVKQQPQCSNNVQQPSQGMYGANINIVHSNSLSQQYMENGIPPNVFVNAQQGNINYQNAQGNLGHFSQPNMPVGQSNRVSVQGNLGIVNDKGYCVMMNQQQHCVSGNVQPGLTNTPQGYQLLPSNHNQIPQQHLRPQNPQPRQNFYAGYDPQTVNMNVNRMCLSSNIPQRPSIGFETPMSQQGAFNPRYTLPHPQNQLVQQRLPVSSEVQYMQNGAKTQVLSNPVVQNHQQLYTASSSNVAMMSRPPHTVVQSTTTASSGTGRLTPPPVSHVGISNNTRVQPVVQQQRQANQADSSGRSSDDSGLSVTPEKPALPQKVNDVAACDGDSKQPPGIHGTNINWNQVPPEVYQLLLNQDAQLKQLQAQIQLLMHNQSASTQYTTTTELNSRTDTPDLQSKENISADSAITNSKAEMCSVAVNTSMFYPPSQNNQERQTVALQTSPQKSRNSPQQVSADARSGNNTPSEGSQCSVDGRTPAEIRHRGLFALNSTERDDFDVDVSNSDLSGVVNNMALHEKTIDSVQSELIVDLPSYHSSPTRSDRTSQDTGSGSAGLSSSSRSPISASMCEQQQYGSYSDSEDEDEEYQGEQLSADNKEYYDKLMNNIHQLLNQNSHEDTEPTHLEDTCNSKPFIPNDTLQQSIMLGQYLNSLQRLENNRNPMETTFIPKINYMSMMLDSDSDTSMEINAMAMKYLKDEQLTKLTKLQNHVAMKGTKETLRLTALRKMLSDDKDPGTPNVTTVGMSPNDLTFATRKYMEKHGLLNDSKNLRKNSTDDISSNESYQLKMNYITNSSEMNSPAHITQEVIKTPSTGRLKSPLQGVQDRCKDSNKFKYPSANLSKETNSPHINSYNTSDNSRSPNMQFTPTPKNTPTNNIRQIQRQNYSTEKTPQDIKRSNLETPTRTSVKSEGFSTPTQRPHHCIDQKHDRINTHSPQQNTPKINNRHALDRVISPIAQDPPEQRQMEFGHYGNVGDKSPSRPSANASWDDADKILDITRLKQLPKLL